jgi:GTP-binding protein LepA
MIAAYLLLEINLLLWGLFPSTPLYFLGFNLSISAGLRCGFLGFLHMEVFNQRLKDEFNMEIVMTTPSVPYYIVYEGDKKDAQDGERVLVSCVSQWPTSHERNSRKFTVMEPIVKVI